MTFLRKLWEGWKRFGQAMGDFLARVVLSIFYFTIFLPFGLGTRLFSDPLAIKPSDETVKWLERKTKDLTLEDARRQA
jgi:hypothetical protein